MALLSRVEAAMRLGIGVELLEYFQTKCPKKDETRILKSKKLGDELFFEDTEIDSYRVYLNRPWPHERGKRPIIPAKIRDDVKFESHLCCAICGDANNGEVAHIEAVSDTLNNSPDNLIYLCPNHHTQYDLGYKPSSNVTLETIQAAKMLKRNSRIRVFRFEANAVRLLQSVMAALRALQDNMQSATSTQLASVYETETRRLMEALPALVEQSEDHARKDLDLTTTEKVVALYAPNVVNLTLGVSLQSSQAQFRTTVREVVASVDKALVEIDEVDCPHCSGRGMVGLVGDFCKYCHGDCVVSNEQAEDYEADAIDDIDCPRCGGRGLTGLNGNYCAFCGGSCYVTRDKAESYDENEIDEVECPRCAGRGTTGLAGDYCAYCRGSCYVSGKKAKEYNEDKIDEVECPRCAGGGTTGLVGQYCAYCRGSCYVSRRKAREYNEDKIDEVECPRCAGSGTTGLRGRLCAFCKGDCFVSRDRAKAYHNSFGE